MSFNPLGNFKPDAPVNQRVLSAARGFYQTLPTIPDHDITRCYLHWTVAPMKCDFTDYNAEAKLVNGLWLLKMEHDPRDNAPGLDNNPLASHTWHRNTGAVGIAITGMDGATEQNFGPDPVTVAGLTYLCAGAAAFCKKYDIDTLGRVSAPGSNHSDNNGGNVNTTGEHNIMTHGECALVDKYPTERWDLGSLVALPPGVVLTPAMRIMCGDALRQMIHSYKATL